jgi:hypothetical protein
VPGRAEEKVKNRWLLNNAAAVFGWSIPSIMGRLKTRTQRGHVAIIKYTHLFSYDVDYNRMIINVNKNIVYVYNVKHLS